MTEPPRTLQERLRAHPGINKTMVQQFRTAVDQRLEAAAALDAQSQLLAARNAKIAGMRGSLVEHITYFQTTEPLLAEAREALGNLVTRLDVIHEDPAFKSVWVVNQLHAGPYTGPKYETELDNARAVLAKLKAATPPAEGDDG